MKRWLGLFAILGVMVAAAVFVLLYLRTLTPEEQHRRFSERCDQVQAGMTEREVDVLFDLNPDRPRTYIGVFGPGLPHITTYPSSGPGDTRILEVTFRDKVVIEKKISNR